MSYGKKRVCAWSGLPAVVSEIHCIENLAIIQRSLVIAKQDGVAFPSKKAFAAW